MSHVTNVHLHSACSTMIKTNVKKEKRYVYLKRQRGTNEFVCISESHLQGQFIHMSFGSEVVVTGFNKYHGILGKERETYRDDSAC